MTRNDRSIAVPQASLLYWEIGNSTHLNATKQIEAFFFNDQEVRSVQVNLLGHCGPEEATDSYVEAAERSRPRERKQLRGDEV
jgi:hypothetical protein